MKNTNITLGQITELIALGKHATALPRGGFRAEVQAFIALIREGRSLRDLLGLKEVPAETGEGCRCSTMDAGHLTAVKDAKERELRLVRDAIGRLETRREKCYGLATGPAFSGTEDGSDAARCEALLLRQSDATAQSMDRELSTKWARAHALVREINHIEAHLAALVA